MYFKIKYNIYLIVCSIFIQSCKLQNESAVQNYLKTYAGIYIINFKDFQPKKNIEVYSLFKNGDAYWLNITSDPQKMLKIDAKKIGYWNATKGKIIITIQTQNGKSIEEFMFSNGKFVNLFDNERILIKTDL